MLEELRGGGVSVEGVGETEGGEGMEGAGESVGEDGGGWGVRGGFGDVVEGCNRHGIFVRAGRLEGGM